MAINVLVIGSGGREHALCWAIAQSPDCIDLWCAPGNGGIAEVAGCRPDLDVSSHDAVIRFCRENMVEFVVIGPEAPLVDGLADSLAEAGIEAFGPSAAAAQLEGSKGFVKELCAENGIPTAAFERFTDPEAAHAHVDAAGVPIVIKADGLAAGKGVVVATDLQQAHNAIDDMFTGEYGDAGSSIVIEEFLAGEEASFFVLVDGENILPLATAQDHKRVGEADTGANTGGMGAYSPAPVMIPEMCDAVMTRIIRPTVTAMAKAGTPFSGVLYAGLMITAEGPKLIEYNVRFGDPECQVLVMRLKSDLLSLLRATARGQLAGVSADWSDQVALTVVLAAKGYPGTYAKGSPIGGLDEIRSGFVQVFHAGTLQKGPDLIANGGRVLNVTALGDTIVEARQRAYEAVDTIEWPDGFCRRDIGWRAVARETTSA